MTYYPDMGTKTMVAVGPNVRAIGWLESGIPFHKMAPLAELLKRLERFVATAADYAEFFGFPRVCGVHRCTLCDESPRARKDRYTSIGTNNIGVPAGEILFVAPELIAHYVGDHHYLPPPEFVVAVIQCPLPGDIEFQTAIKRFREVGSAKTRRGYV